VLLQQFQALGLLKARGWQRTDSTHVLAAVSALDMLSQSGALGLAILDYVQTLHVGLSTFVSVGNRADVSSNDVLAYWADDPRTSVYLESFGNPRRFARLAPDVAQCKPIIAVKSGRSAGFCPAHRPLHLAMAAHIERE